MIDGQSRCMWVAKNYLKPETEVRTCVVQVQRLT